MARAGGGAAEIALEPLDRVQQLERHELGAHEQAGVEETRLVEHLADRIGVVRGRRSLHLDADRGQSIDGRLQVLTALADIGPESEQATLGDAHVRAACALRRGS